MEISGGFYHLHIGLIPFSHRGLLIFPEYYQGIFDNRALHSKIYIQNETVLRQNSMFRLGNHVGEAQNQNNVWHSFGCQNKKHKPRI